MKPCSLPGPMKALGQKIQIREQIHQQALYPENLPGTFSARSPLLLKQLGMQGDSSVFRPSGNALPIPTPFINRNPNSRLYRESCVCSTKTASEKVRGLHRLGAGSALGWFTPLSFPLPLSRGGGAALQPRPVPFRSSPVCGAVELRMDCLLIYY